MTNAQWVLLLNGLINNTTIGYSVKTVNYKHQVDDVNTVLLRDETWMTGIQVFLILNADEYEFDMYDLLLAISGTLGLIYVLRIVMFWLIKF